jgi:hypothetical protein
LRCDAADPLGLRAWIDELKTTGKPIVELSGLFAPSKKDHHDDTTNTTEENEE